MNYEKTSNRSVPGHTVLVKNGVVPGAGRSYHYQNREVSTFVDPDTDLVAEVTHHYCHSLPSNWGWRVTFEDNDAAVEAYAKPGGTFWIRPVLEQENTSPVDPMNWPDEMMGMMEGDQ